MLKLSSGNKKLGILSVDVLRKMETLRLFIIVVLLAMIVLFVWASMAQIDRIVRVDGKIIPAGRSQEI